MSKPDWRALTVGPAPRGGCRRGPGKISVESITRQERLWLSLNLLKKPVPIAELIDDSFARNARAALGIK
jgi:hypothetical protein